MAEYTPTVTGKDGGDLLLASTYGDTHYLGNLWTAEQWTFAVDKHPDPKAAVPVVSAVSAIDYSWWAYTSTAMNGESIVQATTLGDTHYLGNAWTIENWTFAADAIPATKVTAQTVHATAPIDYEPWRINELLMNGESIAQATTLGDTHYLANSWTTAAWTFAANAIPSTLVTAQTVHATSPIDYEPWRINELLMNGETIVQASTLGDTHYLANSWTIAAWTFATDAMPATLVTAQTVYGITAIDLSAWLETPTSKEGGDISFETAKMARTYEYNGWRFDRNWKIVEGMTYPIMFTEIPVVETGVPYQSEKKFVFLEENSQGNILIGDLLYSIAEDTVVADVVVGTAGETVVHEYGGPKLSSPVAQIQSIEGSTLTTATSNTYTFLASAVEDPAALGGYTNYTADTARTVTLKVDAGANVNFYYTLQTTPDFDQVIVMQTHMGAIPAAISYADVSPVKAQLPDGTVGSFVLLPEDHGAASPIRTMTPTGVMALMIPPLA